MAGKLIGSPSTQRDRCWTKIVAVDWPNDILNSLNGIGTVQNSMRKHDEAAANFKLALDKALDLVGPDHYFTKMYLGNLLYTWQNYLSDDGAIQALLDEQGDRLTLPDRRRVLEALLKTLEANSKLDEAAQIRQQFDQLLLTKED
jgi:hypothetical protein